MREVEPLEPGDARRVPWKNGRGFTHELALWPASARFETGEFDWRISKAKIEASGEFSLFPEHDRILVVTAGEGLNLDHGGCAQRSRVRRMEPYRFDGSWVTHAELAAGPVSDFNVITRRGVWRAEVESVNLGARRTRATIPAGHAFIHIVRGELIARVVGEEDPFELETDDSLWLRDLRVEEDVELAGASPDCTLLLVRLALEGE